MLRTRCTVVVVAVHPLQIQQVLTKGGKVVRHLDSRKAAINNGWYGKALAQYTFGTNIWDYRLVK